MTAQGNDNQISQKKNTRDVKQYYSEEEENYDFETSNLSFFEEINENISTPKGHLMNNFTAVILSLIERFRSKDFIKNCPYIIQFIELISIFKHLHITKKKDEILISFELNLQTKTLKRVTNVSIPIKTNIISNFLPRIHQLEGYQSQTSPLGQIQVFDYSIPKYFLSNDGSWVLEGLRPDLVLLGSFMNPIIKDNFSCFNLNENFIEESIVRRMNESESIIEQIKINVSNKVLTLKDYYIQSMDLMKSKVPFFPGYSVFVLYLSTLDDTEQQRFFKDYNRFINEIGQYLNYILKGITNPSLSFKNVNNYEGLTQVMMLLYFILHNFQYPYNNFFNLEITDNEQILVFLEIIYFSDIFSTFKLNLLEKNIFKHKKILSSFSSHSFYDIHGNFLRLAKFSHNVFILKQTFNNNEDDNGKMRHKFIFNVLKGDYCVGNLDLDFAIYSTCLESKIYLHKHAEELNIVFMNRSFSKIISYKELYYFSNNFKLSLKRAILYINESFLKDLNINMKKISNSSDNTKNIRSLNIDKRFYPYIVHFDPYFELFIYSLLSKIDLSTLFSAYRSLVTFKTYILNQKTPENQVLVLTDIPKFQFINSESFCHSMLTIHYLPLVSYLFNYDCFNDNDYLIEFGQSLDIKNLFITNIIPSTHIMSINELISFDPIEDNIGYLYQKFKHCNLKRNNQYLEYNVEKQILLENHLKLILLTFFTFRGLIGRLNMNYSIKDYIINNYIDGKSLTIQMFAQITYIGINYIKQKELISAEKYRNCDYVKFISDKIETLLNEYADNSVNFSNIHNKKIKNFVKLNSQNCPEQDKSIYIFFNDPVSFDICVIFCRKRWGEKVRTYIYSDQNIGEEEEIYDNGEENSEEEEPTEFF